MAERAPRGTRVVGVTALLLGAPVFAELVQSHLDITGELGGRLFLIVFMAPLYGGVALLVREVAVRTSGSPAWTPRHVVAVAFGALLERTLIGFLVPVPPGGDPVGKVVQNVLVLVLVLGLGLLLRHRTRSESAVPAQ